MRGIRSNASISTACFERLPLKIENIIAVFEEKPQKLK